MWALDLLSRKGARPGSGDMGLGSAQPQSGSRDRAVSCGPAVGTSGSDLLSRKVVRQVLEAVQFLLALQQGLAARIRSAAKRLSRLCGFPWPGSGDVGLGSARPQRG
ncbi:hypothetical protein chiPu_0027977 [Chiloscyllium punctatum]|uniref:Uncharacterized protein n=1 Tax=Chiloscyllium punctatum TaxID=137246 RepID=A0A401TLZ7_CHIPU|nr:hypothetical protein [Chiloscyllium punctatum]